MSMGMMLAMLGSLVLAIWGLWMFIYLGLLFKHKEKLNRVVNMLVVLGLVLYLGGLVSVVSFAVAGSSGKIQRPWRIVQESGER